MSSREPLPLVILISGRGSNMLAVAKACREHQIEATIKRVIADRTDAAGIALAADLGMSTELIDRRLAADRESFEQALTKSIDTALGTSAPASAGSLNSTAGLVVLAGFMRVLSADFVEHYTGRMLNIHPSLLPQLRGLHTHRRALEGGNKQHGASVHYVTAELDSGPVVLQSRVGVRPEDTEASLAARVLQTEHVIYPRAIGWIAAGRLQWRSAGPWLDGRPLEQPIVEDFPG